MGVEVKAVVEIEVKDKDGNVKETRIFPSRSWVKNHIKTLYADISACDVTIKDVNGNDQTYEGYAQVVTGCGGGLSMPFSCWLGLARRNKGAEILIGSSDTPWNKDQYCLSSEISGSIMQRGDMEYESDVEHGTEPYIRLKRKFTNVSTDPVTVKEAGVFFTYWEWCHTICGEDEYADTKLLKHMVIRDVLSEPVTVEPEEGLTVKYTLYIVY